MKRAVRFAGWAALLAAAVGASALLLAGPEAWRDVLVGVGLAWSAQAAMFWLLAVRLFPGQPLVVYGLGMLGRFGVLVLAAFGIIPALGVAPVPALLSLAAVLAATTVLEAALLAPSRVPICPAS